MSKRNKSDHTRQCQAYGAAFKRRTRTPLPGDEDVIALGRKCSHESHSGTRRQSTPREATMSAPVSPPAPKSPKAKVSTRRSVDKPAPATSAPTEDTAHSVSLGVKTLFSAAAAVGAYVVLYAAIEPIYHGTSAVLRALVPLSVETIAMGAAYPLVMGKSSLPGYVRAPLVLVAVVIIGACAKAELDAAAAGPAAATRDRVAAVYDHPTKAEKVGMSATPEHEGPQARHQREQNEGAAIALQGAREANARQDMRERLANAKQAIPGEGELTTLLALLGAFGSACFLPYLEAFLRSLSRRPVEAAAPAYVPSRQIAFHEPKEGLLHRLIHWPVRLFGHRQPAAS